MSPIAFWNQIDLLRVGSFVALIAATWILAGWLKARGYVRTGDARKINHAAVLAGGVVWFNSGDSGMDRVSCHLAVSLLFLLLLIVCRYRDWGVFEYAFQGYAREADRPHDAFHVWFSWLVSIVGLELVDLAFGSVALTRCAALVLGLADAVAEPIGSRFGKHRYRVRDILSDVCRQRSWEGSLAVAVMTSVIVFISFSPQWGTDWGFPVFVMASFRLPMALLAGGFVALVEAWTPHGLDNLTIPLGAAVFVRGIMGFTV